MKDEELEKCKDLIEAWKREADEIKDVSNQPKKGGMLDAGGHVGEFGKLTKKYKKLIEERIGHKIWN